MALPQVSFRWTPAPRLLGTRFSRAADHLSKFVGQDVTKKLASDLAETIRRRVRGEATSSEGRFGSKMPRLATLTMALRAAKGIDGDDERRLTEKGDLLDSMVGAKRGRDLLVHFVNIHPRAGVPNSLLALWQNKGTKGYTELEKPDGLYPNRGIPQTDFFGVTDEEELWLENQVEDILMRVTMPNVFATIDGGDKT